MKKLLSFLLSVLMLLSMNGLCVFAEPQYTQVEREIRVLGGSTTADVIIKNGVTMISFDSMAFYLNTGVGSIEGRQAIFGYKHKFSVEEGTKNAFLDGEKVTMPEASFVYDNQLYVPLTFVAQSLGYVVYWREQTKTIYIQSPENYAQALEIVQKSLKAIQEKSAVTTNYTNYTNLSSGQPERYFVESKGVMSTNMKNNIAKDSSQSTVYNGYYDSIEKKPVQIYVNTDPVDSWSSYKYVTENGIYYQTGADSYTKQPVPPENISTMDMATKSVFTDPDLFLYSATIHEDYGNSFSKISKISIKAETDIGLLLKIGFDIYMPQETNSFNWTETYQTIEYDPVTYLPQNLNLSLYANYEYGGDTVHLDYIHNYNFDFGTPVSITLPNNVQ